MPFWIAPRDCPVISRAKIRTTKDSLGAINFMLTSEGRVVILFWRTAKALKTKETPAVSGVCEKTTQNYTIQPSQAQAFFISNSSGPYEVL